MHGVLQRRETRDTSTARLMIVDDHAVVRAGISAMFEREPFIDVVASVASGEEAVEILDEVEPDVVLLDYRLPGLNGAGTCAEIVRRRPETAVIILTTYIDEDVIHMCLAAGARGYLVKDVNATDLADSINAIFYGESVLAPQVTEKVVRWARATKALVDDGPFLSARELSILSMAAKGLSNVEIAMQLGMASHAVKGALRSISKKLEVSTRSEAVAAAVRRGLI